MLFNCVEPTHANIGQNFYAWHYKMGTQLPHHIAFPHVDSCLGAVCELANNRVFAAHINGLLRMDLGWAGSHMQAFNDMLVLLNNEAVQRAIVFGDILNWEQFIHIPWNDANIYIANSCADGVDLLFEVDTGNCQLMRYQLNRNFKAVPLTPLLAAANLNGINGNHRIQV